MCSSTATCPATRPIHTGIRRSSSWPWPPFKRKLQLADGRTMMREFKVGDILYSDGESHVGENVGAAPTHVLLIEMKGEPTRRAAGQ